MYVSFVNEKQKNIQNQQPKIHCQIIIIHQLLSDLKFLPDFPYSSKCGRQAMNQDASRVHIGIGKSHLLHCRNSYREIWRCWDHNTCTTVGGNRDGYGAANKFWGTEDLTSHFPLLDPSLGVYTSSKSVDSWIWNKMSDPGHAMCMNHFSHMFIHTRKWDSWKRTHTHTWIDLTIEIQQSLHQIIVDAVLARPKPHFHRVTLQKHHFCWTDHWIRLMKDSHRNAIASLDITFSAKFHKIFRRPSFFQTPISENSIIGNFQTSTLFEALLPSCQPIITSFAYG